MQSHGLTAGKAVVYNAAGNGLIDGLADQKTYYAIVVDQNTIKLAKTQADAMAATPIKVDITARGLRNSEPELVR